MLTVLEIIKRTTDFFDKRGVESARLNAELLIGHALGLKRMQLYLQFERPLAEAELEKIRPLVKRRGNREPLQYIIGETEFCGLKLKVDRRALIPRPETEYLVEYNLQDSQISRDAMLYMMRGFVALGATPKLTVASTSLSLFRCRYQKTNYFRHPIDVLREQRAALKGGMTIALRRGHIEQMKDEYEFLKKKRASLTSRSDAG